jgi:hypothetical protein
MGFAKTVHVDSMEADNPGTEIRQALHHVLNSRTRSIPTAVFVLTDGEVSVISSYTDVCD